MALDPTEHAAVLVGQFGAEAARLEALDNANQYPAGSADRRYWLAVAAAVGGDR